MSFDDLLKEAESIPAGSEGLQFLPYLSGERTPHPDPLARGAFIGLTVRHSRAHMTRAVLEGVAFGLKDSFTLIQNAGLGSDHASPGLRWWDERRACGGKSLLQCWKPNWSRSTQQKARPMAQRYWRALAQAPGRMSHPHVKPVSRSPEARYLIRHRWMFIEKPIRFIRSYILH